MMLVMNGTTVQAGDHALLGAFARDGDQDAFAQLVARHVDLVYAAAKRQVGDAHLAEDVAQAVFLILAKKAESISASVVVAGWLHNTTRYVAQNARRAEARRQHHELKAGEAMRTTTTSSPTRQSIEGDLDETITRLPVRDRDVIVLRFFQQLSLREVAAAVGISEDAAKMRVGRALAKMRRLMGATAPASALAAVLTNESAQAAPATLARSIALAARGDATSLTAVELMKGALSAMKYAQIKFVGLLVTAVVLAASVATAIAVVLETRSTDRVVAPSPSGSVALAAPDRSTPSRALQTLVAEMLAGTDKGQGWIADTDAERAAGEMISDMYYEAGQLRAAAKEAFDRPLKTPLALQFPTPDLLDGASEVYPAGQTEIAYVIDRSGRSLLPMRKAGNEWKLAVADMGFNLKLDADAMSAQCREKFELYKSLTERVRGGEFASADELERAITRATGK